MDVGRLVFLVFAILFSSFLIYDSTKRIGVIQKSRPILGAGMLLVLTLVVMFT